MALFLWTQLTVGGAHGTCTATPTILHTHATAETSLAIAAIMDCVFA